MPDSPYPTVSVTLAEIARIAGVGRAAVSNWRRRHPTFPSPVGGTDTSPQFALHEVEDWLREQGRLSEEDDSPERVWPMFEALGDRDEMAAAITEVARGTGAQELPGSGRSLSSAQSKAVERAVRLAGRQGGPETFGHLLDRWLGTHVRQVVSTPSPLAALMAALADAAHGESRVRLVLDPACGTGGLLLAAARQWGAAEPPLRLRGQELDGALAELAAARLAMDPDSAGSEPDIQDGDSLRSPRKDTEPADVVLCNPPYNERDWGHEELATDTRWTHGLPPRTESELAWVQHALAGLTPGGTAVLLLPPSVAARRAGRRIRAGLVRSGVLRAVIALPAGAAPPHGVALHLWLLHRPAEGEAAPQRLLLIDTARDDAYGSGKSGINWEGLRDAVLRAVRAHVEDAEHSSVDGLSVPAVDLLDDQVDLTPARHIPAPAAAAGLRLRRSWGQFGDLLQRLQDLTASLSRLELTGDTAAAFASVEELDRAGALSLRLGRLPESIHTHAEQPADDAVRVLTVSDTVSRHSPTTWITADTAARTESTGTLTVTAPGEIIVVGVARAFGAWVDTDAPTALGPQLYAVRTATDLLDPWFLAGCLNAPANARQAGTHASTASRIDVRRLQVPRLPLDDQKRYGEAFRSLSAFEKTLRETDAAGEGLVRAVGDALGTGRLGQGS
ncbi:N-6 DNA methylase [Streptomyces sp. NBC_00444]|uniref:N-6 DNA methylase n=1 Tax=Streptomyces sp. NBC_00444 TaxID=2975744 RepID=UPI002E1A6D4E